MTNPFLHTNNNQFANNGQRTNSFCVFKENSNNNGDKNNNTNVITNYFPHTGSNINQQQQPFGNGGNNPFMNQQQAFNTGNGNGNSGIGNNTMTNVNNANPFLNHNNNNKNDGTGVKTPFTNAITANPIRLPGNNNNNMPFGNTNNNTNNNQQGIGNNMSTFGQGTGIGANVAGIGINPFASSANNQQQMPFQYNNSNSNSNNTGVTNANPFPVNNRNMTSNNLVGNNNGPFNTIGTTNSNTNTNNTNPFNTANSNGNTCIGANGNSYTTNPFVNNNNSTMNRNAFQVGTSTSANNTSGTGGNQNIFAMGNNGNTMNTVPHFNNNAITSNNNNNNNLTSVNNINPSPFTNNQSNAFNPSITNSALSFGVPKSDNQPQPQQQQQQSQGQNVNPFMTASNNINNGTNNNTIFIQPQQSQQQQQQQPQQPQTPFFPNSQTANPQSNPFNIQFQNSQPINPVPLFSSNFTNGNYTSNAPSNIPNNQNSTINYFQSNPQQYLSQIPQEHMFYPSIISQVVNVNQHLSTPSLDEIQSNILASYINTTLLEKDKENNENHPSLHSFLSKTSLNTYQSYSNYDCREYEIEAPPTLRLKPNNHHKKPKSFKQSMNALNNNRTLISRQPQQRSFNLNGANSQSTIRKNSFTFSKAFSQSAYSSCSGASSCVGGGNENANPANIDYEVTITFETPIRLTSVVKTRRYFNKEQVIKDLIERFKERNMKVYPNDFILLLNGSVLNPSVKQIDLSKEAFSFVSQDCLTRRITIAGHFYQAIQEEGGDHGNDKLSNDNNQVKLTNCNNNDDNDDDDDLCQVKDDFIPKCSLYSTTPPMNELQSMSKSQLENISNFTMENSQGKIIFLTPCDLTYINIDDIILKSYLQLIISKDNPMINKIRQKCVIEYYNILLDDTSIYQMNELARLCDTNLHSFQYHYNRDSEKVIINVDLALL